jgi:WD40 repeat protein/class 3 adenylate cyclase
MTDTRVADRYEPLEVVGRGGEATVLKAVDTRHERLVALKVRVVPSAGSSDELLTEARALLSLPPHPGLAHARDDLFDDGRHVLVLDWVEGVNLSRLLADEGRPGLPVSSVLRWTAQAAEALTALHQHGVVHGDVKPANLIVDSNGRVVLVDLGSSSVPTTEAPRGGTPGFRAPEIAAGAPADRVSDVFSLAATAFTLLTGSAPTGKRPSWDGVPADVAERLEAALRTGLSIDPARRPATPGELVERLRAGWDDQTPSGVGTVVLTDVVDSSKLWEQSPQRVPALLAEMQLVVDRNVEEHGGRRIGATVEGDATVSVFPNVSSAVRAAIGLQRGLASRDGGLRVRAGLATGEIVGVEGEVFGPTLNRAARIRELARAGEVLLSASTADVVRMALPAGVDLVALGPHELRGLDAVDEIAAVVAEGVTTPPDPARSPYPGLASFAPEESDLFFGREETIERCLDLFGTEHFVAVVGASGSGKTSLVLAGLAPRLTEFIVVRPGVDPRQSLEQVDLPGHDAAVLIVDQLEELVTLGHDPSEQAAFVDAIVAHPGGLIVAVRADLYGEFGVFDHLADRLASSQVLLGPLAEPDLLRAVHEPARRCGLAVEDGLAEVIAADLEAAPGALPLLGHALREAWLRREGRTITLAGYRASGGVRTAIAATAEQALAELDDEGQAVARRVLLRMVELRLDGDDARRWASHREVTEIEPNRAADVVATLAGARLLVVDRDQITVVHEALLRTWPRLGGWIAAERADLLARQEVRWAAERWVAGGRSDGDLYRSARLDAALELAAREPLPGRDAEFVDAARQLRNRELAETRRSVRRLRVLATVTSLLAVVALVVGAIAVLQRNDAKRARTAADESALVADEAAEEALREAERADVAAEDARTEAQRADAAAADARTEAERADAAAVSADARRVGAQALVANEIDRALLLAVEGVRLDDSPDTRANLLALLQRHPELIDVHRTDGSAPRTIDISPDGTLAALGTGWGDVTFHDTSTWEPVGSYADVPPWDVAFHPSGKQVVVARDSTMLGQPDVIWDPQPLRLIDVPSGAPADEQPGGVPQPALWPRSPVFSADGRMLGAAFQGAVAVWDTEALAEPRQWIPVPIVEPAVALSADGRELYVGGPSSIAVFDVDTGEQLREAELPGAELELSPDGTHLAVADGPEVVLVDASTLVERTRLAGHSDTIQDLRFSHDGTLLASASADTTARVWDAASGARLHVFEGHSGLVEGLAFSPDDRTLYTAGWDHLAMAWDLSGRQRFLRRLDVSADVVDHWGWVLPAPEGDVVAFASFSDGSLRFFDVSTGRTTAPIDARHGAWGIAAWRPDGERLVTSGEDGFVRVWDGASGALVTERRVARGHIGGVGYTPDGSGLMIAERRGVVSTIDAETLEPSGPQIDVGGRPVQAFTSPAESTAIVFTFELEVVLVDLVAGRIVARRTLDHGANLGAFSPDGRFFAEPSLDGRVVLLDGATAATVSDRAAHADQALYTAYSPDGTTFVSSGPDGRVNLSDGTTGAVLASVQPAGPDVGVSAVYGPGGDTVVIVSDDGNVYEWDLGVEKWIDAACAMAGRNLDEREWSEAFPDRAYRRTCPRA